MVLNNKLTSHKVVSIKAYKLIVSAVSIVVWVTQMSKLYTLLPKQLKLLMAWKNAIVIAWVYWLIYTLINSSFCLELPFWRRLHTRVSHAHSSGTRPSLVSLVDYLGMFSFVTVFFLETIPLPSMDYALSWSGWGGGPIIRELCWLELSKTVHMIFNQ